MKQWDIFTWEFPFGKHPAVIVSHPTRVENKPVVNVLKCSSQRVGRAAQENEVMLDKADGLDWETLCQCDLIYVVEKSELTEKRGNVSRPRRRAIISRMIQSCGWVEV
jgi:mRNA-degrading endonuclease toxin of MazEF toxin-antitoxin module